MVAVECKRYGAERELHEDELLTKLTQAKLDLPDLDLWAVAVSRPLNHQLARRLADAASLHDVELRAIQTGDDSPSSLVALLACAPDVTLGHLRECGRPLDLNGVGRALADVGASSDFPRVIACLKARFSDAAIGYDHWRRRQNDYFLDILRCPDLSRAQVRQVISVLSSEAHLIIRQATARALDAWWTQWRTAQRPLAILGDEGDGKTWALAALAPASDMAPFHGALHSSG